MTLTLYPAIDLKDGQCVRLRRGAMDQATVFADAPATQARAWQDAGFAWLHVVDLNGAFAGHPVNAAAVTAILGAVQIPVQLGGGIRDMAGIEAWLAAAGFVDIRITEKPESRAMIAAWAPGSHVEDYVVSGIVEARKPA